MKCRISTKFYLPRVVTSLGIAVCLVAMTGFTPALANNPEPNLSGCNPPGTAQLCLNDNGGLKSGGNEIYMYKYDPDASQTLQISTVYMCGPNDLYDTVQYSSTDPSEDCPFTNSNFDRNYEFDTIEIISFSEVSSTSCVGTVNDETEVALEGCGGPTTIWVSNDLNPGTNTESSLVSVYWCNQGGSKAWVLNGSATSGTQASVQIWANGPYQAWEYDGGTL
jgi:hypothetical protein